MTNKNVCLKLVRIMNRLSLSLNEIIENTLLGVASCTIKSPYLIIIHIEGFASLIGNKKKNLDLRKLLGMTQPLS